MVFFHRFGTLLNTHLHFHCIVIDGVFEADTQGGVTFHPASGVDAQAIAGFQVPSTQISKLTTAETQEILRKSP